jgi:hypothetical protein
MVMYKEVLCVVGPINSRKKSITSEIFDVFMEPLVEKILQLWYGIFVYDITKE